MATEDNSPIVRLDKFFDRFRRGAPCEHKLLLVNIPVREKELRNIRRLREGLIADAPVEEGQLANAPITVDKQIAWLTDNVEAHSALRDALSEARRLQQNLEELSMGSRTLARIDKVIEELEASLEADKVKLSKLDIPLPAQLPFSFDDNAAMTSGLGFALSKCERQLLQVLLKANEYQMKHSNRLRDALADNVLPELIEEIAWLETQIADRPFLEWTLRRKEQLKQELEQQIALGRTDAYFDKGQKSLREMKSWLQEKSGIYSDKPATDRTNFS